MFKSIITKMNDKECVQNFIVNVIAEVFFVVASIFVGLLLKLIFDPYSTTLFEYFLNK